MHDFHYFLYLGCLFTHMNIIIQVSQPSFNFFLNLSNTMLTSAFNKAGKFTTWSVFLRGFEQGVVDVPGEYGNHLGERHYLTFHGTLDESGYAVGREMVSLAGRVELDDSPADHEAKPFSYVPVKVMKNVRFCYFPRINDHYCFFLRSYFGL